MERRDGLPAGSFGLESCFALICLLQTECHTTSILRYSKPGWYSPSKGKRMIEVYLEDSSVDRLAPFDLEPLSLATVASLLFLAECESSTGLTAVAPE